MNWNKSTGVLGHLAEGMVRRTQVMFGEYKLRIGEWQLFVGELFAESTIRELDDKPENRRRELRRGVAIARSTSLTGRPPGS